MPVPDSTLDPSTRVVLNLAGFLSLAGALIWGGWTANATLTGIRSDIQRLAIETSAIREDLKVVAAASWTGQDMKDYVAEVERLNRKISNSDGTTGPTLPDPVIIHLKNQQLGLTRTRP